MILANYGNGTDDRNLIIQMEVCKLMGAEPCGLQTDEMIGISLSALEGELPLNGLRHSYRTGSNPWFVWGGTEFSDDADFFKPLHASHLDEQCPLAVKFLLLPAGWRFLTDGEYDDVWFDPQLLLVQ